MDRLAMELGHTNEYFSERFQSAVNEYLRDGVQKWPSEIVLTLPPLVTIAILRKLNTEFFEYEFGEGNLPQSEAMVTLMKESYLQWLQDPKVVTYQVNGQESKTRSLQSLMILGTRVTLKGKSLAMSVWPNRFEGQPLLQRLATLFVHVLQFWVSIKTTFRNLELDIRRKKGKKQCTVEAYCERYRYGGFTAGLLFDRSYSNGHYLLAPFQTEGAPYTNAHLPDFLLKLLKLEDLGPEIYHKFHNLIGEIREKHPRATTQGSFNFIREGNVDFLLTALPSMLDTSEMETRSEIETTYDGTESSSDGASNMSPTTSSSDAINTLQNVTSDVPSSEHKTTFHRILSKSYREDSGNVYNKEDLEVSASPRIFKFPVDEQALANLYTHQRDHAEVLKNIVELKEWRATTDIAMLELKHENVVQRESISKLNDIISQHDTQLEVLGPFVDRINLGILEFAQSLIPGSLWQNKPRDSIESIRQYKDDRDSAAHGPNLRAHLATVTRFEKFRPCILALYGVTYESLELFDRNRRSSQPAGRKAWDTLALPPANLQIVDEGLLVYCFIQTLRCNPSGKLARELRKGNTDLVLPIAMNDLIKRLKVFKSLGRSNDRLSYQPEEVIQKACDSINAFIERVNLKCGWILTAVERYGNDDLAHQKYYKSLGVDSITVRLELQEWQSIMKLIQFGELAVATAIRQERFGLAIPKLPSWRTGCQFPDKPMDDQKPLNISEVTVPESP